MKPVLFSAWLALLLRMAAAFADPRPRAKVPALALGLLCGDLPKTITSALDWLDQRQQDWSSQYRLLAEAHWEVPQFFAPVLAQALQLPGDPTAPIYAGQDDTLLRKTGKRIPGTAYARDPLSPAFQVNLVLGQRFLQTALLVRPPGEARPWRSIPVAFRHAPPLKAPPRATPEERAAVKEARKRYNLSLLGAEELQQLRAALDQSPAGRDRLLIDAVDGGYANRHFLQSIPERTVVVARLRKNAKLRVYLPPDQRTGPRKYGPDLPTPEALLRDETIPWQELTVFVAGQLRTLKYKVVDRVCWPQGTRDRPLRLILLKAAGYRLRKGAKLLYRQPAFLLATSLDVEVRFLIEAYLARWELEVNFRDEKTILGVGQAQVRSPLSVARTPAFLVAAYAALLVAGLQVFDDQRTDAFAPLPAWRKHPPLRPSARDLVTLLGKEAAAAVLHGRQAAVA
jgi:hypothetical protein